MVQPPEKRLVTERRIAFGTTAPTHAAAGPEVWFDETTDPPTLKGWNGTAYVPLGDTGWRNVTSLLVPASLDPANTGFLHVRRVGELVHYRAGSLLMAAGTGTLTLWDTVPVGFRSVDLQLGSVTRAFSMVHRQSLGFLGDDVAWLAEEDITVGVGTTTRPPSPGISGTTAFLTNDAWPSSLPGVAV